MKIELREKRGFVYARTEPTKDEVEELKVLALKMMRRDLKSLNEDLGLPENTSWQELSDIIEKDSKVREAFSERKYFHLVSYNSEIAMHAFLGYDWRRVFEFNDLHEYGQPDGVLSDGTFYDVYTRSKQRWGLSKRPKAGIEVYVLAHFYAGYTFLVGYATLSELENGPLEKYSRHSVPINQLHPVEFLKGNYNAGLQKRVSEFELCLLQDEVSAR